MLLIEGLVAYMQRNSPNGVHSNGVLLTVQRIWKRKSRVTGQWL